MDKERDRIVQEMDKMDLMRHTKESILDNYDIDKATHEIYKQYKYLTYIKRITQNCNLKYYKTPYGLDVFYKSHAIYIRWKN